MAEIKKIKTVEEMNAEAREALKNTGFAESMFSSRFNKQEGTVSLWDSEGICWLFNLKTRTIVYKSSCNCPMDKETYKATEHVAGIKHNTGCLGAFVFFALLSGAIFVTTGIQTHNQKKKAEAAEKAREKAVLDWTDSVRVAKTDIEYKRALDSLEQAKLKLENYKQKLMSKDDYEY